MKPWLLLACMFVLCTAWILVQAGIIFSFTKRCTYNAQPFERKLTNPDLKILVLGDSTAVGTGSESPQTSTAGWFAKDFPNASVENISQNGLRLKGLREKLGLISDKNYDLVVIQIGANDIMQLTPYSKIGKELETVLSHVNMISKNTIILHSGKLGTARIFIWPFSAILTYRSYRVREIYKKVAKKNNALYTDLIKFNAERKIEDQPQYYAADKLHLNGEGYHSWYQAMRKTLNDASIKL